MAKVVFLMTDTQRYDMVNANVSTGLHTPSLDRLAARGMRFTRAYTTQPVCQPARCGLFTGLYPHSCNSWTNSAALSADVHTIGRRLQDHGVRTAYVGKWHLDGGDYFGLGRCPDGWDPDYWYDMRNYLEELTPEERRASRRSATMEETSDVPAEFTYAYRCTDRAIRFCSSTDRRTISCCVFPTTNPMAPISVRGNTGNRTGTLIFPCPPT